METTQAPLSDARALAMFTLAVVHLFLCALVIPHPGFAVDARDAILAVPGFLWAFFLVWGALAAEALWSLRAPACGVRRAAARALLVCLVPPCRAAVCPAAPASTVWLPRGGWRRVDKVLFETLEMRAAFPMLLVSLLVVPVVAVEFFLADLIIAAPVLALAVHTANAVIWFFFALELAVMLPLAEDKRRYCVQHWINIVIVTLPLLGFLRAVPLLRAVGLANVGQWMHAWRLRGLMFRALRVALFFNLVERFLRRNPERFLKVLRRREREKQDELEKLREDIRAAERALAERGSASCGR